jgi:rhamnose utilization protein RhaD (predicted bifunctional aldolase and dehydrogenase)/NAD(P)-dependent dehydrogenase (short-subunit alcohol dehydrogenase family)
MITMRWRKRIVRDVFKETDAIKVVNQYPEISEDLAYRIYTSRLIGSDNNLVLHGGGNTSVKLRQKNVFGDEQVLLYVKGSGVDLATIGPEGFAGLDLSSLRKLKSLDTISDENFENQMKINKINWLSADPSVEVLLHAFLPHKYVDHTHADSILILTHQKDGEKYIEEALGHRVAVVPYVMSGLPLAKNVATRYEMDPNVEAIIVSNHGIFTFGEDARTSYNRMMDYVDRAESFIQNRVRDKSLITPRTHEVPDKHGEASCARFAQTVRGVCAHRGSEGNIRRFYTEIRNKPELIDISFSKDAPVLCASGVLTPDHVIHTKNQIIYIASVPESDEELRAKVSQEVENFKINYHRYFQHQVEARNIERKELDPFPRVFLVAGIGLVAIGFSRKAARIAADIAEHTLQAKIIAGSIGAYASISDSHIFDMEYWSLQQKKLSRRSLPTLQGQTAVVTGGGGAIGFGIADRLIASGAAVVICDIDEPRMQKIRSILKQRYPEGELEIIAFDVTDYSSIEKAFETISRRLGGIDILVPNAGIAHVAKIEELDPNKFDQVIAVNLKGTFNTIKAAIPVFRRQGTGGNIIVISSKNVFDPGAAFGAYSASKAGAHQISKIAALELAELGIRVNMINPDAVFGTNEISSKLWDLIGPDRMKSRGLDYEGLKEYYRNRNLLKTTVLAEHVGNAVVFFAAEQTPTTGSSLPVDGGIPAAFPR